MSREVLVTDSSCTGTFRFSVFLKHVRTISTTQPQQIIIATPKNSVDDYQASTKPILTMATPKRTRDKPDSTNTINSSPNPSELKRNKDSTLEKSEGIDSEMSSGGNLLAKMNAVADDATPEIVYDEAIIGNPPPTTLFTRLPNVFVKK
jgi:hypothetical protein